MKRYLCVYEDKGSWQDQVRLVLDKKVWLLQKDPPEVPYIQVKIKVTKHEQRYSRQSVWKEKYFKIFGFTFCLSIKGSKRRKQNA